MPIKYRYHVEIGTCSRSIGKQMNKLVLHAVGAAVILKSLTKVQKTRDFEATQYFRMQ